jgi:hypothetical protein
MVGFAVVRALGPRPDCDDDDSPTLKTPAAGDDRSSVTGPRIGCHCAGHLPRGLDVPHVCAALSDHHLTEWRTRRALPAEGLAVPRRMHGWLIATAVFVLAAVPLAPIG